MGGQLSTFEQMMTKKPKATLDNATVLKLWRASVGSDVILQMIRTSNADYDLSANAIIELDYQRAHTRAGNALDNVGRRSPPGSDEQAVTPDTA
jgi:hypothetical protein